MYISRWARVVNGYTRQVLIALISFNVYYVTCYAKARQYFYILRSLGDSKHLLAQILLVNPYLGEKRWMRSFWICAKWNNTTHNGNNTALRLTIPRPIALPNLRHRIFGSGHPYWYWPCSKLLTFGDHTRRNVSAWYGRKTPYDWKHFYAICLYSPSIFLFSVFRRLYWYQYIIFLWSHWVYKIK